jgi:signal transduction histidine kinase
MEVLQWVCGEITAPTLNNGVAWPAVSTALSLVVIAGYCLIGFNWYFQTKVIQREAARPALVRLGVITAVGVVGAGLWFLDASWAIWRGYDLALLLLAVNTWLYLFNMRGLGLVEDRLALTAELEAEAARYREIAELLPDMVWTATADGQVDFCNQRWREYRGDSRSWLEAAHPDERIVAATRWGRAVAERNPFYIDVRLGGVQGYRTFAVRATPIVRGSSVKWLGACADIEDQRLLAMEKELQAKQKSFFLNALSHDLRAPLHNVLLNAHLLKMSSNDPIDPETLNTIMENAVAAGDLVTRLLDFAKVGAHEHNAADRTSLDTLVKQIGRRFAPIAAQKAIALEIKADDSIEILTDRHKLERVVSNLLDNAIKYTQVGGVTLSLAASGEKTFIRIADTGVGVPPEHVPYLFDEFYQVNNYERDRNKGFGMGLAICRCLAQQINASVRLASTGPAGSCFEIVIKNVGVDRRGRSDRAEDDERHPEEARLLRV